MRILVTGSTGFLGSHTIAHMIKQGHRVLGIDVRMPSIHQLKSLNTLESNVHFIQSDICQKEQFDEHIDHSINIHGPIDAIIHLAAYWSYNINSYTYGWCNRQSTTNIIDITKRHNIKQIVYASSITALNEESILTEISPLITSKVHPYGWSKAECERLFDNFICTAKDQSVTLPQISIMRLCGVYSNFCELPPLFWLINRWRTNTIESRIIPGNGLTSMDYLYINDFLNIVDKIIISRPNLQQIERFIASSSNAKSHNDLFKIIKKELNLKSDPIYISKTGVRLGLFLENIASTIGLRPAPFERDWMMDYIDKQILTNSSITQNKLSWSISPESSIEHHLPIILDNYKKDPEKWIQRQFSRGNHQYLYIGE